ncbi:MAG: hypothetical protein BMS9Abin36_0042 [Gammaproteobacteria bacterium]|nr:MAG: hypothetical protein BMS9Abin36_0042 [Gammaproteobacteria bacterium]
MKARARSTGERGHGRCPDRLMMDMNPAGQTMPGYSLAEITGQPTEMLHAHYVEFGDRIRTAFNQGEAVQIESYCYCFQTFALN